MENTITNHQCQQSESQQIKEIAKWKHLKLQIHKLLIIRRLKITFECWVLQSFIQIQ